jgi:hypothetical protein
MSGVRASPLPSRYFPREHNIAVQRDKHRMPSLHVCLPFPLSDAPQSKKSHNLLQKIFHSIDVSLTSTALI